jgi:hypothetical protein
VWRVDWLSVVMVLLAAGIVVGGLAMVFSGARAMSGEDKPRDR